MRICIPAESHIKFRSAFLFMIKTRKNSPFHFYTLHSLLVSVTNLIFYVDP